MPAIRHLRHVLFPVAWAVGLVWTYQAGHDPGYWGLTDPAASYPWAAVLRVGAVITIEVFVLLLVLRPWSYRHAWRRALAASLVWAVPTSWELVHAATHQPGYAYVNFRFTALMFPLLLLLTLVSLVASNRVRHRTSGAA